MSTLAKQQIEEFKDLPLFNEVLTAEGKEFALEKSQQSRLGAIRLSGIGDKKEVAILHTVNASSFEHVMLKKQCLQAGYLIHAVCEVGSAVLVDVYTAQEKKTETQNADWAPDDEALFQRFDEWGLAAVKGCSSDIHIEVREERTKVRLRVHGALYTHFVVDSSIALATLSAAYTFMADPETRSDEVFDITDVRNCVINRVLDNVSWGFRFQSFPALGGLDCVMRVTQTAARGKIETFDELGYLPSQIEDLHYMIQRRGLGLIVGEPGMGKTTTAYSAIDSIKDKDQKKLVSLEDPVEIRFPDMTQISVRRKSNKRRKMDNLDSSDFAESAKTLLRADLNVGFIGEIRDQEVASTVIAMTQAGTKTLATLHAGSAFDAIPRLASEQIGIPRDVLGGRNFISGIVYQVLLPELCNACRRPAGEVLSAEYLEFIAKEYEVSTAKVNVKGSGCPKCNKKGVNGRLVAAEVLILDDFMRRCIRNRQDAECEDYGMKRREASFEDPNMKGKTAFEHGLYLVLQGRVDPRDLERRFEPFSTYCYNKTAMETGSPSVGVTRLLPMCVAEGGKR